MPVRLIEGDITKQRVDVIVNAANSQLAHGGGVARAIALAAGSKLVRESGEHPPVPTGEVGLTTAGDLMANYVIHAVGTVYREGDKEQASQLESCITKSLDLARKLGQGSIAFPAISTGIYGYPVEEAAEIMLGAALAWDGEMDIRFVLFGDTDFHVFEQVLGRLKG